MRRINLALRSTVVLAACLITCHKPPPEPPPKALPAVTKPGTTLTATPDPILNDGGTGETTLNWSTTAAHTEVHIDSPGGTLFVRGGSSGVARTANWVTSGMTFYLQDSDNPNPASPEATLGSLTMVVQ